jgi:plastocyanin
MDDPQLAASGWAKVMQRDVRQRLLLALWVAICLLALATAACGGSETSKQTATAASPTASPPPARGTINIDRFRFPGSVTVPVGAEVTVVNNDPDRHTVTSDSVGEFDVEIQPSSTASFTAPYEPGSYPFHCLYHSSMNGVLVVR